jgi:hypothetical protein
VMDWRQSSRKTVTKFICYRNLYCYRGCDSGFRLASKKRKERLMRLMRLFVLPLLGAVGAVIWFRLAPGARAFGLFEKASSEQIVRITVGYLATVSGVVLGSLYRQLRQLREAGTPEVENPREFLSRAARSVDLWMGLCGSPIVFLLLARANEAMSLAGMVVVALENGFCCLIIVNGFIAKAEGAPRSSGDVSGGKEPEA